MSVARRFVSGFAIALFAVSVFAAELPRALVPAAIFLLAVMATVGIWSRDPFVMWAYEIGIFLVTMCVSLGIPGFAGTWPRSAPP